MRKLITTAIVIWMVLSLISFLAFAFVQIEWNPFEWEKDVRFGYAFLEISLLILSGPLSNLVLLMDDI